MHTERRRPAPLIIASALAIFATSLHADPPPAHYCEIAMDFSIDGKRIAAPSAIVAFGEEGEVMIGDPAEHAWRLRILADAPTVVHRANVIPVSIVLDEIAKGNAFERASPQVKAVPGQRADIETIFGGGDGRHVHIMLVANPRSDAEVEAMRSASPDNPPN
jgi:hypothetical protein